VEGAGDDDSDGVGEGAVRGGRKPPRHTTCGAKKM
jgi:hypothetical protein